MNVEAMDVIAKYKTLLSEEQYKNVVLELQLKKALEEIETLKLTENPYTEENQGN